MFAEITTAFQSVKTAFDLIKATKELSNSTELVTAMNDVQMKLSEAIAAALVSQEKQAGLTERVRDLETQLRAVEDWKSQIQRYALVQFPTGALAHQLKPEMANGEPIHYLCTACADKKKKTILQPEFNWLNCPECKSHIKTQEPPPMNPRTGQGGDNSWMS
jgi:Zn finger protein HypA/HybF involved in hydrogenase expression